MMAKPYKVTFAARGVRKKERRLLMVATADAEWDGTGRDGVTRSKKGQMVRVMKRLHRASEREREREEHEKF